MKHLKLCAAPLCIVSICTFTMEQTDFDDSSDYCVISLENPHQCENKELARAIVEVALGKRHDHVEKILTNRFNGGRKKTTQTIPISKLKGNEQEVELRNRLATDVDESRKRVFSLFSKNKLENVRQTTNDQKLFSELIINELIEERQRLKDDGRNSSWWKRINGCLAGGVSVVTLIEAFILFYQKYFSASSSSCDCSYFNTTI